MNELALFAGAGGGILGGKLLGWRTVCAVELDAYCRRVLLARQRDGFLPRFPIWDDVQTFDGKPWRGSVDVVSGGFPCQDISASGKGAGIEGGRSGMWRHMARIVGEVRPSYVFVENSPMLAIRGGCESLATLPAWGMTADGELLELGTWERHTSATECGFLPTVQKSDSTGTGKTRYVGSPQMRHGKAIEGLRTSLNDPQYIHPDFAEWMMGWPIGWSECRPLATDKFRQWLRSHGVCSEGQTAIVEGRDDL